jgi:hypothetical protein
MLTAITLSGIFPQFPPDFVPPLPLACSGDPVDPASDVKPGRAKSLWDCHVAAWTVRRHLLSASLLPPAA